MHLKNTFVLVFSKQISVFLFVLQTSLLDRSSVRQQHKGRWLRVLLSSDAGHAGSKPLLHLPLRFCRFSLCARRPRTTSSSGQAEVLGLKQPHWTPWQLPNTNLVISKLRASINVHWTIEHFCLKLFNLTVIFPHLPLFLFLSTDVYVMIRLTARTPVKLPRWGEE